MSRPDRRPHRARPAFTLVELLVVIGIIALLMSILLPTLGRVREQANSIKCSSNLRQVGYGITMYLNQSKGFYAPYKNWGRWQDPNNPLEQIDQNHASAYWGVAYAVAGGVPKTVFNCPSAEGTDGAASGNFDGLFADGHVYTCYGLNAYLNQPDGGFADAARVAAFGAPDEIALFQRKGTGTGAASWLGRNSARMRNTTQTILAQDSYEQCVDGNGDTFNSWTQWASPDRSHEFLRHNSRRYCNVVYADTHVGQLNRQEMSDVRFYTGRW
jgi:prepilin-type N-terminal cleavage/methylation domain-containing protein/prepilin-type processing-associated H-X9-DG protein